MLFITALKKIKYLQVNLTKDMKVYGRLSSIDGRNWRHKYGKISCVCGSEELILLKCSFYPKTFVDSKQSLSKSQCIFQKNRKSDPKICMEPQRLWRAKAILRRKNKAEGIILHDLFQSYNNITVWYWYNNRHIDQGKKNQEPR